MDKPLTVGWDEGNARWHHRKHWGVTFEVAAYVFVDKHRIMRYDVEHEDWDPVTGEQEERYQTIGMVGKNHLFVVYTLEPDGSYWMISARIAEKHEREMYDLVRSKQSGKNDFKGWYAAEP
jgi:uncharacterized DUF497 family protein